MNFSSTILCIDDDSDDQGFIQEAIRSYGGSFEVVLANDGEQAMAYLNQARDSGALPCFIIMDINMPRMDGRKTIQLIKQDELLRTIPVAVFTTSSSVADKRYFQLYDVDYITKPPHYSEFARKVSDMLARLPSI